MTNPKPTTAAKAKGIVCPKCACPEHSVYQTRDRNNYIRRVRICKNCGKKIETCEKIIHTSVQ